MTETALLLINSCAVLESLLEQGEWQVEQASSLVVAEKKLQEKDYPLVLVVIEHQQHEALYNLIAQHSGALWIGLIQRDCLASEALRNLLAACFHDFHTFPLDRDRLSHSLGHALGMARLIRRHRPRLQPQLRFIQGESAPIRQLRDQIVRLQHCRLPVLVTGPSGTGKELVARDLHDSSQRAGGPLVAVNCGAIPENLLEAEFFGARKGSYTGAASDREGYFQAARGGTLFLDEIGDLPLAMQSKLLRAIQERSVRPLGSTQEETVDVRIVSATHRDLAADVQAGRFRQDLYYRLNVIELLIPPLRERREDLPALCHALLERIQQESGIPVPQLSEAALQRIAQHPLTGNVRELENLLHRAVALSDGHELHVDGPTQASSAGDAAPPPPPPPPPAAKLVAQAPTPEPTTAPPAGDLQAWLDQRERSLLMQTLHETSFDPVATAARLGVSQRQMRYRIERLNIAIPNPGDSHGAGQ